MFNEEQLEKIREAEKILLKNKEECKNNPLVEEGDSPRKIAMIKKLLTDEGREEFRENMRKQAEKLKD